MSFDEKFVFISVFGLMITSNDALAANGYFTKFLNNKSLEDLKGKISFRSSIYAGYNYGSVLNNPFSGGFSERTTKGQHSPIVGMNFDMLFKLNDRVSLLSGIDVAGMLPATKIDFRNSLRQEANPASNTKAVLGNIDVYKKNVSEVSIDADIAKTKGGTISHEHLSGQNDIIIKKPVIVDNSLANTKDFSAVSIVNATKPNAKEEVIAGQTPTSLLTKDITVSIPVYEKKKHPVYNIETVHVNTGRGIEEGTLKIPAGIMRTGAPTGKRIDVVVGKTQVMEDITVNIPVYERRVVGEAPMDYIDGKPIMKNITTGALVNTKEVVVGKTPVIVMKDITVNVPIYERRTRQVPVFDGTGELKMEDVVIGDFIKRKDRKDISVGKTPAIAMKDITVNVPTDRKDISVGKTPVMKDITVNVPTDKKEVVAQVPMMVNNVAVNVPTDKKEVVIGKTPVTQNVAINTPVIWNGKVVGQTLAFHETAKVKAKDITANVPVYERVAVGQRLATKDITVNIPVYERRTRQVPVFDETGELKMENITIGGFIKEKDRKGIVVQVPMVNNITTGVPAATGERKDIVVVKKPVMEDITVNVPVYEKRVVGEAPMDYIDGKPIMKNITTGALVNTKDIVVGQKPTTKDITVNIPVYEKRARQIPVFDETGKLKTENLYKTITIGRKNTKDIVVQVPMVDNITTGALVNTKEVVVGKTQVMEDIIDSVPVYEKRVVGQTPVMENITVNIPVYEKRARQIPVFDETGKLKTENLYKTITIGRKNTKDIVVQVPMVDNITTGTPLYKKEVVTRTSVNETKDIAVSIPVYERRVVGKTPVLVDSKNVTVPVFEKKSFTTQVPVFDETGETLKKNIIVNTPVYKKVVIGKMPVFNEAGEVEMKDITANVPAYEKSETEIIKKIPQSAKETTITIPKYEMIVENKGNTLSDNTFTVKTGVNTGERKDIVVGQKPTMEDITVNIPVYEKKEHAIKTPNIVKVGVRKIGVTTKQVPMFVNYEQDIATVPASNNIEENIQISEQSSTQIKTKAHTHEILVEKDKEVVVLEPKQHISNYNNDYSIREFGKLSANFGADIKITKYINLTVYGSAGINLARINYSESNIVSTFMNDELIDLTKISSSINKFNIGQTFSLGSRVLLYDKYEISASYRVSINSNSSIKSNVPLKNTVYTHNFMLTIGYRWF